jgi:hypothetical protein
MRNKLLNLRKWFLQLTANIIYFKLITSNNDIEFNYWLFYGLWLDSWCVDRNIWLK